MKRFVIGLLLFASIASSADVTQEMDPSADRQPQKDKAVGTNVVSAMLGVFTPLQFPGADSHVKGVRLNFLYGTCCRFNGLDIGCLGVSKERADGCLIKLANLTYGDGSGFHAGGVNHLSGDFNGVQFGLFNWADTAEAFQFGLLNGAYDLLGLQLGMINVTDKMKGLQIGLVNIIYYSNLSFFPIINGWF
jgi:hypothetical protein